MPDLSQQYVPIPDAREFKAPMAAPKSAGAIAPPTPDAMFGKMMASVQKQNSGADLNAQLNTPILTRLDETLRYTDPNIGYNPFDNNLEYKYADTHPVTTFRNNLIQAGARFVGAAAETIATIPIALSSIGSDKSLLETLHNNDMTNGVSDWLDGLQNSLPTYTTEYEKEHPVLKYLTPWKLGSFAGAIGSTVNNFGYTAGAIAGALIEDIAITAATGGVGLFPALAANGAQLTKAISRIGKIAVTAPQEISALVRGGARAADVVETGLQTTRSLARAGEVSEFTGSAGALARNEGDNIISQGVKNADEIAASAKANGINNKVNYAYNYYKVRDAVKYNLALLTSASAEGAFEAVEVRKRGLEELKKDYFDMYNHDATGEELKAMEKSSIDVANNAMMANVALLYLSNRINWGSLFKPTSNAIQETISGFGKGIARNTMKTTADDAGKITYSVLTKTPETAIGKILLNGEKFGKIGLRSINESIEEGSQFIISESNIDYARAKFDAKERGEVASYMKSFAKGVDKTFNTNEGWDNMVGGFVGGIFGGGIMKKVQGGQSDQAKLKYQVELMNSARFNGTFENKIQEASVQSYLGQKYKKAVEQEDVFAAKNTKTQMLYNWVASGVRANSYEKRLEELDMVRDFEGTAFKNYWGVEDTEQNRQQVNTFLDGVKEKADKIKKNVERIDYLTKNPYNAKKQPQDYEAYNSYKDELARSLYESSDYQDRIAEVSATLKKLTPNLNIQSALNLTSIGGLRETLKNINKTALNVAAQIQNTEEGSDIQKELEAKYNSLDSISRLLQPLITDTTVTENNFVKESAFNGAKYVAVLQKLYDLNNGINFEQNSFLDNKKRISDGNTLYVESQDSKQTNHDQLAEALLNLQDIYKLSEANLDVQRYYNFLRQGVGQIDFTTRAKQFMEYNNNLSTEEREQLGKTPEEIENELEEKLREDIIAPKNAEQTDTAERETMRKAAKKTVNKEPLTQEEQDLVDAKPIYFTNEVKIQQELKKQVDEKINNKQSKSTENKTAAKKAASKTEQTVHNLFGMFSANRDTMQNRSNLFNAIFNSGINGVFSKLKATFKLLEDVQEGYTFIPGTKMFRKTFGENLTITHEGNDIGILRPQDSIYLDKEGRRSIYDLTKEEYADVTGNTATSYEDFMASIKAYRESYNKLKAEIAANQNNDKDSIQKRKKAEIDKIVKRIFPKTKLTEILYHGTRTQEQFTEFDENRIGELDSGYFGRGFYFSPSKSYAEGYSKQYDGYTIHAIVNLENPLETDANKANTKISLDNYDGAIVRTGEELYPELNPIAVDPNEIGEVVVKTAKQIHILSEAEINEINEINTKYDKELANQGKEITYDEINKYFDLSINLGSRDQQNTDPSKDVILKNANYKPDGRILISFIDTVDNKTGKSVKSTEPFIVNAKELTPEQLAKAEAFLAKQGKKISGDVNRYAVVFPVNGEYSPIGVVYARNAESTETDRKSFFDLIKSVASGKLSDEEISNAIETIAQKHFLANADRKVKQSFTNMTFTEDGDFVINIFNAQYKVNKQIYIDKTKLQNTNDYKGLMNLVNNSLTEEAAKDPMFKKLSIVINENSLKRQIPTDESVEKLDDIADTIKLATGNPDIFVNYNINFTPKQGSAASGNNQAKVTTLPKDLQGAKPRYAYGSKKFELAFKSDIDKAAYITAQSNKSKRDADYLKFVMDATGLTEAEVRTLGQQVRDAVKAIAKDQEGDTTIDVNQVYTEKKAEPTPAPITTVDPDQAKKDAITQEYELKRREVINDRNKNLTPAELKIKEALLKDPKLSYSINNLAGVTGLKREDIAAYINNVNNFNDQISVLKGIQAQKIANLSNKESNVFAKSKAGIVTVMQDLFNLPKDQAQAVSEIYEANANAWAKRTGKGVADYYKNLGFASQLNNAPQANVLNQIIGEQGVQNLEDAENILGNLEVAKQMQAKAMYSRSQIRVATGWELSGDNKWRYEIEDDIVFNPQVFKNFRFSVDVKLGDLLADSELLKAYPQLKDITVSKLEKSNSSLFSATDNVIGITKNKFKIDQNNTKQLTAESIEAIKGTLIHEIQHAIQNIEGFAFGSIASKFSRNYFVEKYKKLQEKQNTVKDEVEKNKITKEIEELKNVLYGTPSELESYAYDQYKRVAGEVEARNAKERMNYTAVQRLNNTLVSTEDIDEESKIYLQDKLDVANSIKTKVQQAIDLVNSGIVKGYTAQILVDAANNNQAEFISMLNEVAQQANDPRSLNATVATYGQELIDLAKQISTDNNLLYQQTNSQAVEQLRAAEKVEMAATDPKDKAKRKEIYDRYDKLITPLLNKDNLLYQETEEPISYDESKKEVRKVGKFNRDYDYGTGSRIKFVIEDGNKVDVNDIILNQGPKGAYNTMTNVIYALTDPNVSTPLHEMAHSWEQTLTAEERAKILAWANPYTIDSLANSHVIYKNGKKVSIEYKTLEEAQTRLNELNTWTRETSEAFAKGFELYLAEGNKTNNPELTSLFDKFAKWLTDIYNNLKEALGIELNDDMRNIYSDMINSDFVAPVVKKVLAKNIKIDVTTTDQEVYKVNITNDGENVGSITAYNDGEFLTINDVQVTNTRQGIGIEAYRKLAKEATKMGLMLQSDSISTRLSPEAKGLWNKLVQSGEAVENGDNFVFEAIADEVVISELTDAVNIDFSTNFDNEREYRVIDNNDKTLAGPFATNEEAMSTMKTINQLNGFPNVEVNPLNVPLTDKTDFAAVSAVQKAVTNGYYEKQIANKVLTADQVKEILTSAGLSPDVVDGMVFKIENPNLIESLKEGVPQGINITYLRSSINAAIKDGRFGTAIKDGVITVEKAKEILNYFGVPTTNFQAIFDAIKAKQNEDLKSSVPTEQEQAAAEAALKVITANKAAIPMGEVGNLIKDLFEAEDTATIKQVLLENPEMVAAINTAATAQANAVKDIIEPIVEETEVVETDKYVAYTEVVDGQKITKYGKVKEELGLITVLEDEAGDEVDKLTDKLIPATKAQYENTVTKTSIEEAKYKKGDKVVYGTDGTNYTITGAEQRAKPVNKKTVRDGVASTEEVDSTTKEIFYTTKEGAIISESGITGKARKTAVEAKMEIKQEHVQRAAALNRIAQSFQRIFPQIKYDIGYFDFEAPARFYKGVVQVNVGYNDKRYTIDEINKINATTGYFNQPYFSRDVIAHEFMHPFILALKISNNTLYNNLVKDLNANNKDITDHVTDLINRGTYTEENRNDEGLALYLGREMTKAFNKNGTINTDYVESRKKNLIKRFITWLKDTVNYLTGKFKPVTLEEFISRANSDFKNQTEAIRGNIYKVEALKDIYNKKYASDLKKFVRFFSTEYNLLGEDKFITKYGIDNEAEILQLQFDIDNYINQKASGRFTFQTGINANSFVEIDQKGLDNIIITLDEEFGNTLSNPALLTVYANKIDEQHREEFIKLVNDNFYKKMGADKDRESLKVGELYPMMNLRDLSDLIVSQFEEEGPDSDFRINNTIPKFTIDYTGEELGAIDELEAYMELEEPEAKKIRKRIVTKLAALKDTAERRLNSEVLKLNYNAIKKLDLDAESDVDFVLQYMQQASLSINLGWRTYNQMLQDLSTNKGNVTKAALTRFNKELSVVRQLVSFYDEFSKYSRFEESIDSKDFIKFQKSLASVELLKQSMQDAAINLTVEWFTPYIQQHNKFIKQSGTTDEKYQLTPEQLYEFFKYGTGKDTNFITFWLGANVTSRDPINAVFANTVADMLSFNNIDIVRKAFDINEDFDKFLKEKGLSISNTKEQEEYYKKHYLRQAEILSYRYNEAGEPIPVYIKKTAFHQQYFFDQYEKDLAVEREKYKNPRNSTEAQAFNDAIELWKKNANYGKSTKYFNKDYAALASDKYFKILEKYYNDANVRYGNDALQFGIIPQKYSVNFLDKAKRIIADVKTGKTAQDKFDITKDKITGALAGIKKDNRQYNLDGTIYRTINSNLTSAKEEENISLDLHQSVIDFVTEGTNYGSLKETQYQAETLSMLLEGNTKFSIPARKFSQADFNAKITDPMKFKQAQEKLAELEDAKTAGDPYDKVLYDTLTKKVAKGIEEKKVWDNFLPKLKPATTNYNNEMLIGQINDLYFGESTEEVKIGNVSANKLAHYLSLYTSINSMAGNTLAALSNVNVGNLQLFIEGHGGQYFNKKELAKATADYIKNIPEFIKDLQNPIKSKDTQLSFLLDAVQGEVQDEFGNRVSGNIAQKMFRLNSLFLLTSLGEHQIQITGMKAMMLGRKVETKSGEQITLYDAFIKDAAGRYNLRTDLKNFGKDELAKFIRDLHGVNRNLNGNYSDLNKTMLQRKWYGTLMLKFRKYLYPAFRTRWASEHTDYERNVVETGYMRYFFGTYIRNGVKALLAKANIIYNEDDYKINTSFTKGRTNFQQVAMRKSSMELGIYLGITIIASLLFGGDGDDKKELTSAEKFALLMMLRLRSDLGMYHIDIASESKRQLKNPTASLNTVIAFADVLTQMWSPTEVYEQKTGKHEAGDSKLAARVKKLVPIYSKLNIDIDDKLGYFDLINRNIEGISRKQSIN